MDDFPTEIKWMGKKASLLYTLEQAIAKVDGGK